MRRLVGVCALGLCAWIAAAGLASAAEDAAAAQDRREVALEKLVVTLPFAQASRQPLRRAVVSLVFEMDPAWDGPDSLAPTSGPTARFLDRLLQALHAEGFGGADPPPDPAWHKQRLKAALREAGTQAFGDHLLGLHVRDISIH